MEVENYAILESDEVTELVKLVNNNIRLGWQPFGSMTIKSYKCFEYDEWCTKYIYYQAIVKYK